MFIKKILVAAVVLLMLTTSCTDTDIKNNKPENYKNDITRYPAALDLGRGKLASLPSFDKYSNKPFQVDLRSYDLASLNISDRMDDLLKADFDTKTRWPYKLPKGYNPKSVMKLGKNPGLNIRDVHKKGVTGRGVSIAIIGEPLLVEHYEYKEQLRYYTEVDKTDISASAGGTAVASIIAGKTTGAAPGADLYYVGGNFTPDNNKTNIEEGNGGNFPSTPEVNTNNVFSMISMAINKVLDINEKLPEENRIRVICIAVEWPANDSRFHIMDETMEKAKEKGILIVASQIFNVYYYDIDFNGLGRKPPADPDDIGSYGPGIVWENDFFMFARYTHAEEALLAPMDSRGVASPTGREEYTYYSIGQRTFSAAYIAGLYALACQAKPGITPEMFWNAALKTGERRLVEMNSFKRKLGRIVNPLKLIESLK